MFYNKVGQEIESEAWGKLFQSDEYKIIRQEVLPDGKWVSTIWLGIFFEFENSDTPLIFETMVFDKYGDEIDKNRYSTEEEARLGHEEIIKNHSK